VNVSFNNEFVTECIKPRRSREKYFGVNGTMLAQLSVVDIGYNLPSEEFGGAIFVKSNVGIWKHLGQLRLARLRRAADVFNDQYEIDPWLC